MGGDRGCGGRGGEFVVWVVDPCCFNWEEEDGDVVGDVTVDDNGRLPPPEATIPPCNMRRDVLRASYALVLSPCSR